MKEFWNQRYSSSDYVYGTEPNSFFSEAIRQLEPGRILLPGDGEGRNAVHAASLGWHVDASDQSSSGAAKARALARRNGVRIRYHIGDLMDQSFKRSWYDAAALIFVHLPPGVRSLVHSRIAGALKRGGMLLLEAFHTSQLGRGTGGPQSIDMLYDLEQVLADFPGVEMVQSEVREADLDEGTFHRGKAMVIRVRGFKS